jgi:hypothetical protein
VHRGKAVRNGQKLPSSVAGACQECECRRGNIECQQVQCTNVVCLNLVQGECCQECSGCHYDGQDYKNGARFSDPEDRCRECRCLYGSVECTHKVWKSFYTECGKLIIDLLCVCVCECECVCVSVCV